MEFVGGKREVGCVFCKLIHKKPKEDSKHFILHRGQYNFVIMNRFPYNNGHLMVIPYTHISSMDSLNDKAGLELFRLVSHATRVMKKTLGAQGFNIGFNLGKAGGAGIEDHLHCHVIPRWLGDNNFWPILAETKSMPEHLRTTYQRIKKAWKFI